MQVFDSAGCQAILAVGSEVGMEAVNSMAASMLRCCHDSDDHNAVRQQYAQDMRRIADLQWEDIIRPCYYKGERENRPYELGLMLRLYILQNLYNMSDEVTATEVIDSRASSEFCEVDNSNEVPGGDVSNQSRNRYKAAHEDVGRCTSWK